MVVKKSMHIIYTWAKGGGQCEIEIIQNIVLQVLIKQSPARAELFVFLLVYAL